MTRNLIIKSGRKYYQMLIGHHFFGSDDLILIELCPPKKGPFKILEINDGRKKVFKLTLKQIKFGRYITAESKNGKKIYLPIERLYMDIS